MNLSAVGWGHITTVIFFYGLEIPCVCNILWLKEKQVNRLGEKAGSEIKMSVLLCFCHPLTCCWSKQNVTMYWCVQQHSGCVLLGVFSSHQTFRVLPKLPTSFLLSTENKLRKTWLAKSLWVGKDGLPIYDQVNLDVQLLDAVSYTQSRRIAQRKCKGKHSYYFIFKKSHTPPPPCCCLSHWMFSLHWTPDT